MEGGGCEKVLVLHIVELTQGWSILAGQGVQQNIFGPILLVVLGQDGLGNGGDEGALQQEMLRLSC